MQHYTLDRDDRADGDRPQTFQVEHATQDEATLVPTWRQAVA